jgi:antitoxin CptB
MKELDILLQRWLKGRYDEASEVQRAGFEALLELPDPELAAYVLGAMIPPDAQLAAAVREILDYVG